MEQPKPLENPFSRMKEMILEEVDQAPLKLQDEFSLSNAAAKSVWLSCPEFQEKFCRQGIHGRKARGGSQYGSKHFLRRRFRLTEKELDEIFDDIWNNPPDQVSKVFLKMMTIEKIGEVHLTKIAGTEIKNLKAKYGLPL